MVGSCAGADEPGSQRQRRWIPACAGMTSSLAAVPSEGSGDLKLRYLKPKEVNKRQDLIRSPTTEIHQTLRGLLRLPIVVTAIVRVRRPLTNKGK